VNHFDRLPQGILNAWQSRSTCAAAVVNSMPEVKVAYDFGAGKMGIRGMLECSYVPVDYRKTCPETIVADLNSEFPRVARETPAARVALCLGVIEYLERVKEFWSNLAKNFGTVVWTFIDTNKYRNPAPCANKLSRQEVERVAREAYPEVRFLCRPHGTCGVLYLARRRLR
jgi:hypothetical protein